MRVDTREAIGEIDPLELQAGRPVELNGVPGMGLTRLGYRMLAAPARISPVVVVDHRGWASPLAAWEAGIDRDKLVFVRCGDSGPWAQVVASLVDGAGAVMAEVPRNAREKDLRRLTALSRSRRAHLIFRTVGDILPQGVVHRRLRAVGVSWEGTERGHGRLTRRKLLLEASGKGVGGMTRRVEVEDVGTLRVVSELVAPPSRRAVG